MVPDLDPDKPDPDPVWPDLDPAISGSGSGLPGSRSGNIRIWIRLLPDLDPVAAGSKVPHGLSGPVQALGPAPCWAPGVQGCFLNTFLLETFCRFCTVCLKKNVT